MRIIGLRCQSVTIGRSLVGLPVAVGVAQAKDSSRRGHVDPALPIDRQAHRPARSFEKRADAVGAAVAIGILENSDPVGGRPGVVLRAKVRVAFDRQHSAPIVDRNARGRDDLGLDGEQLDGQSSIDGLGISSPRQQATCRHRSPKTSNIRIAATLRVVQPLCQTARFVRASKTLVQHSE